MTKKFLTITCILLSAILQIDAQIDVCNGFEDVLERGAWTLANGTQTNKWVMNSGTHNGSGSYSLYISNSPTAATPPNTYTSSYSDVWAWIDVEFPECDEAFTLSFDWKCAGEGSYDYMYVYIGNATVTPTAGSSTVPAGAVRLNGPNGGRFNLQNNWTRFTTSLDAVIYSGQLKRIFFFWHNDGSVVYNPPVAIDNFCITECVPCDQPVVTVVPSSAIVCGGESVTLTATATGGAGNYTYEWSPAATLSSTNTAVTVATPTANTIYALRVTDGADCPRTVRVPVEVCGTTLSISSSPEVYCLGTDPVTLNAELSVSGSCDSYTYRWSNNATGSVITDVPQQTTTYTVTATPAPALAGCCTLTATHTVEVNNCSNECIGFETPAERAEWTFVNGSQANKWVTGTATNNGGQYSMYISHSPNSFTPPNAYIGTTSTVWAYKEFEFPECDDDFVLSFDWRCGGESSFDYMSVFIGEYAAVSAGSTTAPAGAVRLLNADATSTYYQNYFNTYSNYNGNWHHCEIILRQGDYSGRLATLYFMWHNDGSVVHDPPIALDNICMLTCVPCDQPVVTVNPTSLRLCQGESATITATATGGAGNYTYSWSPAATCNPATGPTVTVSPEENTIYRLRVEDSTGCAKTVRIPVEISGTTLTLIADPPGFCNIVPETVTITARLNVEGSCNSYNYLWSTGATGTSIVVNPSVSTTYSVTATPTDPDCCELHSSILVVVMDCQADGCPSISPAEMGTNNTEVIYDCNYGSEEVILNANVIATAVEANDYFVIPLPYDPPYGFADGTRIFVNATDDVWNTAINLPFAFCFYGQIFTQIAAGANAVATFNTAVAGNYCTWSFHESIPNTNLFPNCIFACYRDIYPSAYDFVPATGSGGIFEGVLGEYPCRSYVLSFNNIKLFSCTEVRTFSTMIVLYEGTNIIDIYVRDAPTCPSWNSGNGLIGLQNSDCTRGITPPGRNTGPWTASQEAWRFIPTGEPQYDVTWYLGTDTSAATGVILGTEEQLTVIPTETSDYTARLRYTACNGDHFDIINTARITVDINLPEINLTATPDTLCPNQETTVTLDVDTTGMIDYVWNNGETGMQFTTIPDSTVTTYSVTITFDNGCLLSDSVTVYAVAEIAPPVLTTDPVSGEMCAGKCCTITSDEHHTYTWNTGDTTASIRVCPATTTNYSLTITDELGCTSSAETQVVIHPNPVAVFSPERYLTFLDNGEANVRFIDFSQETSTWLWNFGDTYSNSNSSTNRSPEHIYTHSGIYTITLNVASDFGCTDSTSNQISIQNPFYFYVPNSFTPDGDGINEVWMPVGEGVDESNYICSVYDRFGRLVFTTNSLHQGWDGTEKGKNLPTGSYVYVIQTSTMDAVPKEFLGTVTLIR